MPKMTTARWMRVANRTPDTREGNELYDWIDYRTHGKVWSRDVSIAIPPHLKGLYDAALAEVEEEERVDREKVERAREEKRREREGTG